MAADGCAEKMGQFLGKGERDPWPCAHTDNAPRVKDIHGAIIRRYGVEGPRWCEDPEGTSTETVDESLKAGLTRPCPLVKALGPDGRDLGNRSRVGDFLFELTAVEMAHVDKGSVRRSRMSVQSVTAAVSR